MYAPEVETDDAKLLAQVEALVSQLGGGRTLSALTGAGCSTESGIPDYRGPETRRRARSPIRFHDFLKSPKARRRYWARALLGYARFQNSTPNAAHRALSALERAGPLTGLITQNVDDLHERAGSQRVVALHGSLSRVRCLACQTLSDRDTLQARLIAANPGFVSLPASPAPDGDADLSDDALADFVVIDCEKCGGPLKPHVVFFGENVPPARVQAAYDICDQSDALLVVGSSLEVFSGLRFVRRAAQQGKPIAIVNVGPTRGDALASLKLEAVAGQLLPEVVQQLV